MSEIWILKYRRRTDSRPSINLSERYELSARHDLLVWSWLDTCGRYSVICAQFLLQNWIWNPLKCAHVSEVIGHNRLLSSTMVSARCLHVVRSEVYSCPLCVHCCCIDCIDQLAYKDILMEIWWPCLTLFHIFLLTLWYPLLPHGYRTTDIKHPVPDRVVICNFWHPGTLTPRAERQSARMSKITNVYLTLSCTGCFVASTHVATVGVNGWMDGWMVRV